MQEITERIFTFNSAFKPELISLKYKLMAENAFRFFRGTCHIFYEDLNKASPLPSSPIAGFAETCTLKILVVTRVIIVWYILI